jgi:hypothetical protein
LESGRLRRERRTIAVMIEMYCAGNHGPAGVLCAECEPLLAYAMRRIDRCPYGPDKPTCARCPIHCYRPSERERVRRVMRWSGPRMLLRHPALTVRHYADQVRRRVEAGPGRRGRAS